MNIGKAPTGLLVLTLLCSAAAQDPENKDEQDPKFFIKSYSTTTWTFLSSFTSTVPYTCYRTYQTSACQGRRLRRTRMADMTGDFKSFDLAGSLDDSAAQESESEKEKFFFTLWRTASTTVTVTTYSTNRSVTVSISVACTYPGYVSNIC
ncbi:uncharacterized protein [Procambarus clarkii]|uniref:uncharacterized protein n=1 Tax=Procambarus clarkii TaxID=6728 RepID=UPI003742EFB7